MVSPENSNYWSHFDYATLIDDIPVPDDPYAGFAWSTQPIDAPSNVVRAEDAVGLFLCSVLLCNNSVDVHFIRLILFTEYVSGSQIEVFGQWSSLPCAPVFRALSTTPRNLGSEMAYDTVSRNLVQRRGNVLFCLFKLFMIWVRSESCSASSSKACREKLRRDRLNDKFMELGSILQPGRPPKTDKSAILIDAVRMVTQLRGEAQKLKDSNTSLQERIKELKAEKNELRDEKQRLKAEKERLEQQLKAMNAQPSFMPPAPSAIPAAFAAAPGQAPGNKLVPLIGYPGVAMWQFMPPAAVDTSQDHVLRPPVA
ncbi:hypothetical protein GOBAR_AA00299 [Gossypium barbadense]|uniref:BHLH domain-containing protein n=7 Tax=Gossypium TaxID=3633 RepID=A0A2P5YXA9_GOSBA|nr:hypothetical protein GOBAR_AA00299 [Gossypium barbadense]